MDFGYLVLCGAMWSQFADEDAGHELIRALSSPDAEVRVLARAMLEDAGVRSKVLIGEALANREISILQARLCAFEQLSRREFPAARGLARSRRAGMAA
jgi:hypothetical protein